MSEAPFDRQELLHDSQATLREVAGILHELWDLHEADGSEGSPSNVPAPGPAPASHPQVGVAEVLTHTHREVMALQDGIGALREILPFAFLEAEKRRSPAVGLEGARGRKVTRAAEILRDVQDRLDRLAGEIEHQGYVME